MKLCIAVLALRGYAHSHIHAWCLNVPTKVIPMVSVADDLKNEGNLHFLKKKNEKRLGRKHLLKMPPHKNKMITIKLPCL